MPSLTRLLVLAAILAAIALFFALDLDRHLSFEALVAGRDRIAARVDEQPLTAVVIYAAVYVTVTALSLPGAAILTLAGGALFGLATGVIVVSFASTAGATLAFLASRFLFRDAVRRRFGARLAPIEDGIRRDGAFYLLALRLVPAFPFFLVNLLMGLTPIRTATYWWVSQLGMLPATIAFVWAGTELSRLSSPADVLSPGLIGALLVLGLLPLVLRAVLRAAERRRAWRGHRRPRRFDYDLAVIGAGAAGLVSAYIGATARARVALIERERMGGDCLNTGCVPSKALIRAARLVHEARHADRLGLEPMAPTVDFGRVMQRVREAIAAIEPHDSVERYRGLGVDCIAGNARLVSPWEVEVDRRRISARSIIVATGARPAMPELPGLAEVAPLTSESLWDLGQLPGRLVVLGGGPIGCELAQAFARLGSRVTVVELGPRLLPREDPEVSDALAAVFAREDIDVRQTHRAVRVERGGADGAGTLVATGPDGEVRLDFDRLLVAVGRRARVEGFGLEALGVRLTPRGTVEADALMRTRVPNIAVCGDVAGPFQFTHVAAHQAWYAVVNQLIAPFWSFRVDHSVIPWVSFTDPAVARVGLSETEARERGIAVEVTRYGLDDLDRAIVDGSAEGFVKVLTEPGRDRVLGVTIVHAEAGELVAPWVMAMRHGIGLNRMLGTIHAYPTLMEANKYVAGAWKRAHAPERVLALAARYFRWRRG